VNLLNSTRQSVGIATSNPYIFADWIVILHLVATQTLTILLLSVRVYSIPNELLQQAFVGILLQFLRYFKQVFIHGYAI
jgi:hypothetical protein